MTKLLFGIFAHPDDEAFGPVGTLISEVHSGTKLHLILLTQGEAGANPDNVPDLGKTRVDEWQKSASLIGASSTHLLDYADGQLNNTSMQKIADKIEQIIHELTTSDNSEIDFITLDLNGITGHVDHIVAARAATLAYHRLKNGGLRMNSIRYFCVPETNAPNANTDWIFAEKGRSTREIHEIIDAKQYLAEIRGAIAAHQSQRDDAATILKNLGDSLGIEHFIVSK